ncbi:MAG: ABC transporter ATP-binding protein [Elusimicrobia bacterium]|nr:ABC transporter ATP-binding protein [Elusimicrobiota bacterium]
MKADRLSLENVSYEICGQHLLQDICLEIPPAGVTGLIGPNGAGKSTLLRVLSGMIHPAFGRVRLGARDLADFSKRELARLIAFVPQNVLADFAFPAQEVVMMGRYPFRGRFEPIQPEDHQAVRQAMERTDTWHLAKRSVTAMSGGERQGVHLARAVAQQPDFLLLDEPTAHLDIRHEMALLDMVRGLGQTRGVAIVLHDLNLAARNCDRLALLSRGRIVAVGRPEEVLTPETVQEVFGVKSVGQWHDILGAWQLAFLHNTAEVPAGRGT